MLPLRPVQERFHGKGQSVSEKHHFSASMGTVHPADEPSYSLYRWGGLHPTPWLRKQAPFAIRAEHTDHFRLMIFFCLRPVFTCCCFTCGVILVSGFHNLPGPEVVLPHRQGQQEVTAEDLHPESAQEVQPASETASSLLHSNNTACLLCFLPCLVWLCHQIAARLQGNS